MEETPSRQSDPHGKFVHLPDEAIHYFTPAFHKKHARVPPNTPDFDIDYQQFLEHKALNIDNVRIKELPKVSEQGIKDSITMLGKQLGFDQYEYDLVQFWLLDILTDCLWKAQDVFKFDEVEQKFLLDWISALLNLIADPNLNLSRKLFLQVFKRILREVYEKIASNCDPFPSTEVIPMIVDRFCIDLENSKDGLSDSDSDSESESTSTLSISSQDSDCSLLDPDFNISEHIKYLKTHNPMGNTFHGHMCNDMESVASILTSPEGASKDNVSQAEAPTNAATSSTETDDERTLRPLHPVDPVCGCQLSPSKIYCSCVHGFLLPGEERNLDYYQMFTDHTMLTPKESAPCNTPEAEYVEHASVSNIITNSLANVHLSEDHDENEEHANSEVFEESEKDIDKEEELLKDWAYFKLMEQRNLDMNDSRTGWIPWQSWLNEQRSFNSKDNNGDDKVTDEFVALRQHFPVIKQSKDCPTPIKQLNFNILRAIIDFVFVYFYEDFHFTLIKFAFRFPPNFITQTINKHWWIPKVMKTQFKRPKGPKKPKEPKPKAAKAKIKKGNDKESAKEVKKEVQKKGKKKEKQFDKPKAVKRAKHVLTDDEIAALEKQRLEQVRLEEEKLAAEEERVYLRPLADAATDQLFADIFHNWESAKSAHNDKTNAKKSKKLFKKI